MRTNCDLCNSKFLVKLSTCKHPSLNKMGYMECSECGHVMPWHLDDKQKPLVSNNRMTQK